MTARGGGAGEHPDEIVIASYLEGGLAGASLGEVEAHLAACDTCRAGVSLLRLEPDSSGTEGAAGLPEDLIARARSLGTRRHGGRWWLASAAGVGLLIAAGALGWWTTRGDRDAGTTVFRDGRSAEIDPLAPLSPASGALVDRDRLLFSWTPVAGADRYVLTVLGPAGDVLASLEASADHRSAGWPPDRPLPPPGPLVWKVRALALDRTLAESRPVSVVVR